jgi:hypothetical protein
MIFWVRIGVPKRAALSRENGVEHRPYDETDALRLAPAGQNVLQDRSAKTSISPERTADRRDPSSQGGESPRLCLERRIACGDPPVGQQDKWEIWHGEK